MNDWPKINKVYSSIIPSHCPPTRVCTAVPLGSDVGVILTAVAHRLVSRTQKIIHQTHHTVDRDYVNVQSISHWAPACIGPYSQCIRVIKLLLTISRTNYLRFFKCVGRNNKQLNRHRTFPNKNPVNKSLKLKLVSNRFIGGIVRPQIRYWQACKSVILE